MGVARFIPVLRAIMIVMAGRRHQTQRISRSRRGAGVGAAAMNCEYVENNNFTGFKLNIDRISLVKLLRRQRSRDDGACSIRITMLADMFGAV